jgi:hypothetical protein
MARLSLALKMFSCAAALGYISTILVVFMPPTSRIPIALAIGLCPTCLWFATEDVPLPMIFLLLAPVNAALYGGIAYVLGKFFSRPHDSISSDGCWPSKRE